MLSIKAQYNLANARSYFREHLETGEYYSQSRRVCGRWFGKGVKALGLSGEVKENDFLNLCEGLNPQTQDFLTQRKKNVRKDGAGGVVANRRVFYDFTISPPKSVSIAALVGGDDRIIEAHEKAVQSALEELESVAQTRVRKGGISANRDTGNVITAKFDHETSRMLDPHLHSHLVFFNATWDPKEERWKALENHRMLQTRKYVENVYYHQLARELRHLGYGIENRNRGDFEIAGVDQELIDAFSKRHNQIDQALKNFLARHPEKTERNIAEIRELLALENRPEKERDVSDERLRRLWDEQLTPDDRNVLANLKNQNTETHPRFATAEEALSWVEEHLFERKSVVREDQLIGAALEHARGEDFSVADLKRALSEHEHLIRFPHEPHKLTTHEIINREAEIVRMARDGRGRHEPFVAGVMFEESGLSPDQRQAAEKLLRSKGFLTIFRGGAGTGKSFTLRAVKEELDKAGHSTVVIAPQRQQVIGLEQDGLGSGQTVSELLARRELPENAVVLLDEAGQIGARQMHELLALVQERKGRIICSGDTRQHGAVEASDALWAIEKYANIEPVELNRIRRQDPTKAKTQAEREQIKAYRQAVEDASKGQIEKSFEKLEGMGAIESCALGEQQARLAQSYVEHAVAGETTVVVSQTWSEIHKVNRAVREKLQELGKIKKQEQVIRTLEPIDATKAQKSDTTFMQRQDQVIVTNRKVAGFPKGERVKIIGDTGKSFIVESEERIRTVRKSAADHLSVFREQDMALAKGDKLQLKSNGESTEGSRLANGELVTVKRVLKDGRIRLDDGRTLPTTYRQFVRGFAVTSYGSQGKTVDHVLFSDSAVKAATNRRQYYVTISRGRKSVRIFTTDPQQLKESVEALGQDELALDLNHQSAQRMTQQVANSRLGIGHKLGTQKHQGHSPKT